MNGEHEMAVAAPPRHSGDWPAVAEVALVLAVNAGFEAIRSIFSLKGAGTVGVVVACVLSWWLLRRGGRSLEAIGLIRPRRWWKTTLAALAGTVGIIVATGVVEPFVWQFTGRTQDLSAFANMPGNLPVFMFWIALAWSTAAFGEEILFRGFILGRLADGFGGGRGAVAGALVLQAVFFGLGHAYQGPAGMIMVFIIGMGIGILFLATGRNLWAPILAHGIIDTLGLTMIYLGKM